uniref:Uncharacterized protein n=1 Tax=Chromera velia CCMP2878 TaxID=1169474 RepID=A0A0G4FGM3_9ALVE|eukprot:Cvel_16904.t1-p1 / transcript=Cvel_16904.t1 / gene=Cvel_16904 / organism=Chromera_velia_CCMP2878 / gene_product=hypothetical protein / transcript_product=hypothetical protein / location=Cvel_scaffold1323:36382-39148(+) / protein_length=294 / sequence_SO=supercontig / SO=protein_coding / is_pseudo=false
MMQKSGMTPELEQLYSHIASKRPVQRSKFKEWMKVMDAKSDYSNILKKQTAELGLAYDEETGRLKYTKDFEPVPISYEICYVRHGKTAGNTEPRVYQGQVDYPENALNEIGLQQAEDAAKLLDKAVADGWKPDLIVYSPLSRAKNTGEAFAKLHPDIPTETMDSTAEMAFGEWDNMMVKDVDPEDTAHLFYLDQNSLVKADKPHVLTYEGNREIPAENFVDMLIRMKGALLAINEHEKVKGKTDAKVAIYGHSMAGAALLILVGNGKQDELGLGFDGSFIMANATPCFLKAKKP